MPDSDDEETAVIHRLTELDLMPLGRLLHHPDRYYVGAAKKGGDLRVKTRVILWRNTYLVSPLPLFKFVICDAEYDAVLEDKCSTSGKTLFLNRVMRNLLPWFWPQIVEAKLWAAAAEELRYAPSNYKRTNPRPLLSMLLRDVPKGWSILDLGCNMGADLSIMRANGYSELYGVDAGRRAIELFAISFPETFREERIERNLFQRYLLRQKSRAFDVVYSHGATLELVHPSFPIVKEICRVARRAVT